VSGPIGSEATASPHPSRVVVLNDRSLAFGGATGLALLSARLLRQRGIAVTLLAGDAGANPALAAEGITVHALGGATLLEAGAAASLRRGLYNAATLDLVGDYIRRHDDPGTVYHIHTWAQILSPSLFKALEPVRDRVFVSAHDFFLTCPNGAYALFRQGRVCPHVPLSLACVTTHCDRRSYAHKLWRVARQAVQARTLHYVGGTPRVLAIHAAMRPLLVRGGVPDAAITTLPNPIQPWSRTRIPAERNRNFVFVGRLHEEKGPDLAARAAREAGVPLVVIGDGPMLETLKQTYPEVTFAGRQPAEAVAQLVRDARALVMPSRYPEPYGLVAGEALWSGIPVILTDQALLAADIAAREAGIACDLHSDTSLPEAMRRLAQDDVLAERMSRNAFDNTGDLGHDTDGWIDAMLGAYAAALPPRAA
jgi:glycosyltransferase involved in cell wall biosynthesis